MKLRKYTKVFKNRKSAVAFRDRMEYRWQRDGLSEEYYPDYNLTFDESARKRRARFTVTYYLAKYNKEQKINESDLYGKNASDATAKFKKAIADNFKNHKLIIKSVKFKISHGDNLKLYTFRYYLKPKK